MKRIFVSFLTIVLILNGCAEGPAAPEDPLAKWRSAAALEARETPEELYAAALNEDILVVYSTSTRMMDAAASFERHYPGLTVKVEHIREPELYERLAASYEAGDFACDVIISADGRGIMTNEFLHRGIAVKYVPYDIREKILPGNDGDLLMLAGEASVFSYNDSYYTAPPVNSWWELTEEKWRGKVYMPNPTRSVTTLALFMMIIQNSDLMAEAYQELYGQPLQVPEGQTAGHVFIERLVENGASIVNSSDETSEEIGMPGSGSEAVGIIISSKTRLRDIGYEMTNHYGMEPFCGVYTPVSVMLAGGAPNINAAKLFVRWLLGEADGQGEGYKPYLQSGAWTVRKDVRDDTGVRIEELNLLAQDKTYQYDNQEAFLDFWEGLMARRKSE